MSPAENTLLHPLNHCKNVCRKEGFPTGSCDFHVHNYSASPSNPLRVFSNGVHPKHLSVKANRFISPYCYKPCPKFYFVCICLVLRNKVIAIFINDHVEAVTGKESLCSQAVLINSIDGRQKNRHLRLAGTPRNSISLICNFPPYQCKDRGFPSGQAKDLARG